MKLRHLFFACSGVFVMMFSLLLLVVIVFSDEEDGGSIWRSVLADGICSWWMEAAFTTGTEARSATVPP